MRSIAGLETLCWDSPREPHWRPEVTVACNGISEEIEKLRALRDRGTITESEFTLGKAQIFQPQPEEARNPGNFTVNLNDRPVRVKDSHGGKAFKFVFVSLFVILLLSGLAAWAGSVNKEDASRPTQNSEFISGFASGPESLAFGRTNFSAT